MVIGTMFTHNIVGLDYEDYEDKKKSMSPSTCAIASGYA